MLKKHKQFTILTFVMLAAALFADTIRVPADYTEIQNGIDAAEPGDTVLVADGVFTGEFNRNLNFQGKDIVVKSENGSDNCIIDCENLGRGFVIVNGETLAAVIEGFTIVNGYIDGSGAGIRLFESDATIRNNILRNCTATEKGGGISCTGASPLITENIIENNYSLVNGGGIHTKSQSQPEISYNIIAGNEAAWYGGGIFCRNEPSPTLHRNTIVNNSAGIAGGGIYSYFSETAVSNCIFWNNLPNELDDADCFENEITVSCSNVKDGYFGNGNISEYPQFRNIFEGDYTLLEQSPCSAAMRPVCGTTGALDVELPLNIILGRPTASSMTVSVFTLNDLIVYLEYGTESGFYDIQLEHMPVMPGIPVEILLEDLAPDTQYFYRVKYRFIGLEAFTDGPEYHFRTQPPPGTEFTFTIIADSHYGSQMGWGGYDNQKSLYNRTLLNMREDSSDFSIDMGDTFLCDKLEMNDMATYEAALGRHEDQRIMFGNIAHTSPLFLVLGNHEGESGWYRDDTPDNIAVYATNARKVMYPNPEPDQFFSGDIFEHLFVGLRESYYSWEWGDALFVVLDPYWDTTEWQEEYEGMAIGWGSTIGDNQYSWLKETLEASDSRFKFVFIHHILGTGRGGDEIHHLYEWGGYDENGEYEFDVERPTWEMPIHDLMVENHVNIFFQGHDHVFVKQIVDGVIYQTCPMPGDRNENLANLYYFTSGVQLPNSGHLRVTVNSSSALVEYVKSYLPEDENEENVNGDVEYYYQVDYNPPYMPGDVNLDSEINVLDLVLGIEIILFELETVPYQFETTDLNLDGILNVIDMVHLVDLIL